LINGQIDITEDDGWMDGWMYGELNTMSQPGDRCSQERKEGGLVAVAGAVAAQNKRLERYKSL